MIEWDKVALDIAREIEKKVVPLFEKKESKKIVGRNPSGDETKLMDKKAEEIAIRRLSELDVNIVSEEIGNINKNNKYTAVIDPVDGSFNFANGIPFFCFSIAFFENKKPIYGMVYEFLRKNVYEAYVKNGAYLNGKKIKVNKRRKSYTISFYTLGKGLNLVNKIRRIRNLGSIALELAYLAKGSIDGIVDIRRHIRPTDIAAGFIIAEEAGAIICDEKGKKIWYQLNATDRINFIAVNSEDLLRLVISNIK